MTNYKSQYLIIHKTYLEILNKYILNKSCPTQALNCCNNLLHHSHTQHCYFHHHNIDLQPIQGVNIHSGEEIDLEILSRHIQNSSCPNPILYYHNNLLHHSYTQHCYFRHHNIDLQSNQDVNIHLGEEIDLEILSRYILNKSCPTRALNCCNKLLHHSYNQHYCCHHHKIDLQTIVGSHIHCLLVLYPMRFIMYMN